jgi:hypothetical protein
MTGETAKPHLRARMRDALIAMSADQRKAYASKRAMTSDAAADRILQLFMDMLKTTDELADSEVEIVTALLNAGAEDMRHLSYVLFVKLKLIPRSLRADLATGGPVVKQGGADCIADRLVLELEGWAFDRVNPQRAEWPTTPGRRQT